MSVFRRRTPQPGSQVMLLLPLAQDLRERGDELSAQLVCTRDPGLVVLFAAALGAAAPPERAVHLYLAVRISPDAAYVAPIEGDSPRGGSLPLPQRRGPRLRALRPPPQSVISSVENLASIQRRMPSFAASCQR
jgi:hypothetical protein